MTCQQQHDVDLAAFVARPDDPEWRVFRAHYPSCSECSASLAAWSTTDARLRAGLAPEHPSDAELLAYADSEPHTRDAARQHVATHLETCAPCRDAVTAMTAFELPVAMPAAAAHETEASPWTRLRDWLPMHPAPAFALAALAGLVLFWGLPQLAVAPGEPGPIDPAPIAEAPSAPAAEDSPLSAPLLAVEPPGVPIAAEPRVAEPAAEPQPGSESAPPVIADAEPRAQPHTAPAPSARELAAVSAEPLDYVAPRGMPGGRVAAASRGGNARADLVPLAPEAIGLTRAARPTLYLYVPAATDQSIVVTLSDIDAMTTLLETTLPGPHSAGLLKVRSVELEPQRDYQWMVAYADDVESAQGAVIRRIAAPAALSSALDAAAPEQELRLLAQNGYWYDLVDTLSRAIARNPTEASLRRARAELLASEGLAAPATVDAGRGH